jgi:hypothetical protein
MISSLHFTSIKDIYKAAASNKLFIAHVSLIKDFYLYLLQYDNKRDHFSRMFPRKIIKISKDNKNNFVSPCLMLPILDALEIGSYTNIH